MLVVGRCSIKICACHGAQEKRFPLKLLFLAKLRSKLCSARECIYSPKLVYCPLTTLVTPISNSGDADGASENGADSGQLRAVFQVSGNLCGNSAKFLPKSPCGTFLQ